jgi:hypothetical protein
LLDIDMMPRAGIVTAITLGARFTIPGAPTPTGQSADEGGSRLDELASRHITQSDRFTRDEPSPAPSPRNHFIHTGHTSNRSSTSRSRVLIVSQLRHHSSALRAEANHIHVIH